VAAETEAADGGADDAALDEKGEGDYTVGDDRHGPVDMPAARRGKGQGDG
jgi:hypothetical protein